MRRGGDRRRVVGTALDPLLNRAVPDDPSAADFGTLLALRKVNTPSVILFRRGSQHRPSDQAELLEANLPQLADALQAGSIVVIQPDRIRIRALPLLP